MTNKTADAFLFFRAWLSAPLRVASVTPSGRALSSLMTVEISAQTGIVIEVGPGTGVFTEALLKRGVAEENLVPAESRAFGPSSGSVRSPTWLRWRMALAREALKSGTARVEEIAFSIGYKSASAFSTAFTQAVGCSPSRFAERPSRSE